ncbi:hypothetical protein Glove_99g376 [Diversispora epigaea]|uniref:Uncharacterized protein n=1 Tax=Diversispora epigaea TaxID=1348612 RepID=A0A397JEG6_9GLOM|nr:hypothetical protein Glove_99g376 [Diversispora epigaea]
MNDNYRLVKMKFIKLAISLTLIIYFAASSLASTVPPTPTSLPPPESLKMGKFFNKEKRSPDLAGDVGRIK